MSEGLRPKGDFQLNAFRPNNPPPLKCLFIQICSKIKLLFLQGLKNVIGQATTIGRTSETTEDDADTTSTNNTESTNVESTSTNNVESSAETSLTEPDHPTTPPEIQSPGLGQSDSSSVHQVRKFGLNFLVAGKMQNIRSVLFSSASNRKLNRLFLCCKTISKGQSNLIE